MSMPRRQASQRQRPVVTYLATTLAACVATLITALWSTTGHAVEDIRAVATCVETLR
jgi:hypothetical protein